MTVKELLMTYVKQSDVTIIQNGKSTVYGQYTLCTKHKDLLEMKVMVFAIDKNYNLIIII